MKKNLSLLILLLIIPQVALAAWWNPLSWFDSWSFVRTDNEKEALEERVKELEEKLEETESVEITETATSTTEVVENNDTTKSAPTSTSKPKTSHEIPKSTQTQIPVTSIKTTPSIDDLINDYTSFRDYVASELDELDKRSELSSEREFYSYLSDLLNRAEGGLRYLWTVKSWSQKPADIEAVYESKLNELKSNYKTESSTYVVEREKNETSLAKQKVINYIANNKNQLYISSIHIEAAELLYLFDKVFGTNYAKEFDTKKTQQETVEFANRFLIDQGY